MKRVLVCIYFSIAALFIFASDVRLEGLWSYKFDEKNEVINIKGSSLNNYSEWDTGSLKLVLYLSTYPFSGSNQEYILGQCPFTSLKTKTGYHNFNKDIVIEENIPDGSYYVTLAVAERINYQYVIVGYITFENQITL